MVPGIRFFLLVLMAAPGMAHEPPPPASMRVRTLENVLPSALAIAVHMAASPACKEAFAENGMDPEEELRSGRWYVTLVGGSWVVHPDGSLTAMYGNYLCGSDGIGVTAAAVAQGPFWVGRVIMHELAHAAICRSKPKAGPAAREKYAQETERACREVFVSE